MERAILLPHPEVETILNMPGIAFLACAVRISVTVPNTMPMPGHGASSSGYASRLPGRLKDLQQALALARSRPEDEGVLQAARHQAHKLRGSAGTYGFTAVGNAVRRIDEILCSVLEGQHPLQPEMWPQLEAAVEEAMQAARVDTPTAVPAPGFVVGSACILVVDDDPDFLQYVTAWTRRQLLDTVPASTVAQALRLARERPPDAAIIDVILAGTDNSFRLAHQLRALPGCEGLPLAFISSDDRVVQRVAAAHAGAALYLTKPLDYGAFGTAIRQLVAMRHAGRPSILVVDDDEEASAQLASILSGAGMSVNTLSHAPRILETLQDVRPEILVTDVRMAGLDGFEMCRMLRITPPWQELPILFVTADSGPEERKQAFACGGDDFLSKPVDQEELLARIRVRVNRIRLLKERFDRDAVTGLFLRRAFLEALTSRFNEAERYARPLSICLLDLDHFKLINDTHGHQVGDRVLSGLGKLLTWRLRAQDVGGRWGGEEFILAFPGISPNHIHGVVSRLLAEFASIPFEGERGERFHVTFSAGTATYPSDGETLDVLLRVADRRVYGAKNSGRNRVVSAP